MNVKIRWQNLVRSIYIEIILDGCPTADHDDVQKFIEVFQWTANGTITENEFSEVYQAWLQSSLVPPAGQEQHGAPTVRLSEKDLRHIFGNISENELDVMLGLLINEQNRIDLARNPSKFSLSWLQQVEQLFFMLDSLGFGYITVDELHFFVMALIGSDSTSLTPEQLLLHTKEFMKRVRPHEGVLTLRRFKEFFHRNNFDEQTIVSTIECLEQECESAWKTLPIMGSNEGLPRLWEQAVKDAKANSGGSTINFSDLDNFLLTDSHEVRLSVLDKLFDPKGVDAVFREFAKHYHELFSGTAAAESAMKTNPYYTQIQATLHRYRELLQMVLDKFEPVDTEITEYIDNGNNRHHNSFSPNSIASYPISTHTNDTTPVANISNRLLSAVRDQQSTPPSTTSSVNSMKQTRSRFESDLNTSSTSIRSRIGNSGAQQQQQQQLQTPNSNQKSYESTQHVADLSTAPMEKGSVEDDLVSLRSTEVSLLSIDNTAPVVDVRQPGRAEGDLIMENIPPSAADQQQPPTSAQQKQMSNQINEDEGHHLMPLEFDLLVRNAEWSDIRLDNLATFQPLETRASLAYRTVLPLQQSVHYPINGPRPYQASTPTALLQQQQQPSVQQGRITPQLQQHGSQQQQPPQQAQYSTQPPVAAEEAKAIEPPVRTETPIPSIVEQASLSDRRSSLVDKRHTVETTNLVAANEAVDQSLLDDDEAAWIPVITRSVSEGLKSYLKSKKKQPSNYQAKATDTNNNDNTADLASEISQSSVAVPQGGSPTLETDTASASEKTAGVTRLESQQQQQQQQQQQHEQQTDKTDNESLRSFSSHSHLNNDFDSGSELSANNNNNTTKNKNTSGGGTGSKNPTNSIYSESETEDGSQKVPLYRATLRPKYLQALAHVDEPNDPLRMPYTGGSTASTSSNYYYYNNDRSMSHGSNTPTNRDRDDMTPTHLKELLKMMESGAYDGNKIFQLMKEREQQKKLEAEQQLQHQLQQQQQQQPQLQQYQMQYNPQSAAFQKVHADMMQAQQQIQLQQQFLLQQQQQQQKMHRHGSSSSVSSGRSSINPSPIESVLLRSSFHATPQLPYFSQQPAGAGGPLKPMTAATLRTLQQQNNPQQQQQQQQQQQMQLQQQQQQQMGLMRQGATSNQALSSDFTMYDPNSNAALTPSSSSSFVPSYQPTTPSPPPPAPPQPAQPHPHPLQQPQQYQQHQYYPYTQQTQQQHQHHYEDNNNIGGVSSSGSSSGGPMATTTTTTTTSNGGPGKVIRPVNLSQVPHKQMDALRQQYQKREAAGGAGKKSFMSSYPGAKSQVTLSLPNLPTNYHLLRPGENNNNNNNNAPSSSRRHNNSTTANNNNNNNNKKFFEEREKGWKL